MQSTVQIRKSYPIVNATVKNAERKYNMLYEHTSNAQNALITGYTSMQ